MSARTGTATVMFTDVVGSTRLRAALGEERSDELRRAHDQLLTACVSRADGTVIKGGGDGIMATFESAAGGVGAAVAIQQAVWLYNRRAERPAELAIRIGLSTGDVTWEGGDCYGLPVVEAARLEAAAEGGQILCSELVRMARGRGGHEFRSIGFVELKGLPEPLAACDVPWTPPEEDATAVAGRLPLPPELAADAARPFVSRVTELETAIGLVQDPLRRRAGVVWLLGEPGIGKTRLAVEVAQRCYSHGATVLFGRCNEDLSVPYQPFLEALRWCVAHLPEDALPAALGPNPAELTRLLPELGERFAGLAPRTSTSREIEQYRLFEAMRGWLAAQSATSPLVLVVDDAQWATAETLQMLGHVARSAEPSGLVLVCTARTTAPDSSPQLADLATDLQRASVPARVAALADLAEAEVAELVLAQGGERLAGSATRLFRETGGNPLFLVTLLAAFTGGSWDLAESLPSSVQEIVRRRLRTVPGEVVELLRLAALVGLDFDLKIVAAAFAAQEEELIDRLDIATAAGLVVETGYNRYRFAHGLVREALRSEVSETRRVRTHARIGLAIEQLNPDLVDELAHHFWEAREAGHGQAAYRYALAAGTRAVALPSYGDAVGHFSRAVLLAPTSERPGWRLAQGLAEHHSGDMLRGLATMGAAAREAELAGQLEVFADAALAMEANSWQPAAFSEEVADLLERALTALGADAVDRSIRLRASLGRAWLYSGRSIEAYELGSQALADARGLGNHETIGYALVRFAYNAPQWRDTASLPSLVDELGDLVGHSADDDLVMQAMNLRLLLLSRLGRLAEIRKENPGFAARAESLREPFWSFGSRFYALGLAFAEGELTRVEQIIEQIQEMEQNVGAGDHSGADGLRTFQLRREQGRLAEIEPAMGLLLRLRSRASLWQPGLAATLAGLGWLEETRQVLDGLELSSLADDNLRELALCLLSEAVDALDGHPLALQLYRELLPSSGLSVHFGHGLVSPGPVDRYLGMLAAFTGDRQQAEQHFAAALQLARAMSAPLYIGHVLADWGRWLVRWGCATDAVGMLAEAAAIAEANQLKALRQRVGSGR